MGHSQFNDGKSYAAITGAYWGFTLTDGALRMLVLLHFHALGFSPIDLALMFLLYEAMGMLTNFIGGWIGAKHGLKLTLLTGLVVQIGALIMLSGVQSNWAFALSVIYVMTAQAFSGIAKDLTKMSAKSAVKRVVPENKQGLLFRWVALLTGSKNALKGAGFLLGGVILQFLGFRAALWSLAAFLIFVLLAVTGLITSDLGGKQKVTSRDLFSKSGKLTFFPPHECFFRITGCLVCCWRPHFLTRQFGWSFDQVGGLMATWVIGYGTVQAVAPKLSHMYLMLGAARGRQNYGEHCCVLFRWPCCWLDASCHGLVGGSTFSQAVIGGLCLFGIIFAIALLCIPF